MKEALALVAILSLLPKKRALMQMESRQLHHIEGMKSWG
jgi:hypothetical protein